MGRQLFEIYPAFRESIISLDRVYEARTGHSMIGSTGIFSRTTACEPLPAVWPIAVILPSIAMVQIALVDLLRSIGITPDAVVGHSAGETVMLYASGACSRTMALELAIARGKAMALTEGHGGSMAALSCSQADAEAIIAEAVGKDAAGKVEIACFNATDAVALAGLEVHLDEVIKVATEKGTLARKIRTGVPVHSSLMERCHTEYVRLIEEVFVRSPGVHTPSIPTFSTVTGSRWTSDFGADYMWQGTRQPVQFVKAMDSIMAEYPTAHFLEIAAHPVLASYIINASPSSTVVCPMRRSKVVQPNDEAVNVLKAVGQLAVLGCSTPDVSSLTGCNFASLDMRLPAYPFTEKHVPYYPESSRMVARQMASYDRPLSRPDLRLGAQTHLDLAEHIIRGEPIMPAAGFLEMVCAM